VSADLYKRPDRGAIAAKMRGQLPGAKPGDRATPAERDATESRERLEADMWRILKLNGVVTATQRTLMADLLDAIDDHAGRLGSIWVEATAEEARAEARRRDADAEVRAAAGAGPDAECRCSCGAAIPRRSPVGRPPATCADCARKARRDYDHDRRSAAAPRRCPSCRAPLPDHLITCERPA
jgi:hypothetical protein